MTSVLAFVTFATATVFPLNMAAGGTFLEGGAYEVTYRLEVPNVERFAIDFSKRICVSGSKSGMPRALPVLSQNNPLTKCPATAIRSVGEELTFEIHCPGRRYQSAQASAAFKLSRGHFEGRIHMIMGGKNMTFVEVQKGHRVGDCSLNGIPETMLH
jgi:hypothetical protein